LAKECTFQGGQFVGRLGSVEAKEFSEFAAVLSILVDTELDVLSESLVKLGKVVLVFRDLADEIHRFLHKVFADDLEDLVLLESLTRNVEGKILRVDDTLDEVQVLWNEVFTIVHDEDSADVKLDVVAFLL
jgi:hypothetical protein